jgi:hypothetical protein
MTETRKRCLMSDAAYLHLCYLYLCYLYVYLWYVFLLLFFIFWPCAGPTMLYAMFLSVHLGLGVESHSFMPR